MREAFEAAMSRYYHGEVSAARPEALGRAMPHGGPMFHPAGDWRLTVACPECHSRIAPGIRYATRGGAVFHRSCAHAFDARERRAVALPCGPVAPNTIGRIAGVAVLLGEPCECSVKGGVIREQFQPGAFTRWLRAGIDVALKVDHGVALAGRYVLLEEQQGELRFAFDLEDAAAERHALEAIRAGRCRGCSVAFHPSMHQWGWNGGHVLMRTDARLTEISLCISGRPAWCGTSVRELRPGE